MRKVDLTGQRFERLTVLCETDPHICPSRAHVRFLCKCECGAEVKIMARHLVSGRVKSCGCYRRENPHPRLRHGHARTGKHTPTYIIWSGMIKRCTNPKCRSYVRYGGRGITVCDRWKDSFENFLADMGERPEGKSLDRIDVDGNYEPSNCRWATRIVQANNTRTNILINHEGYEFTMAQLARKYGIQYRKFRHMYRDRGLSVDQIISEAKNESM